MDSTKDFEQLLYKNVSDSNKINESDGYSYGISHDQYRLLNNIISALDPETKRMVFDELSDIDTHSLSADELEELSNIIADVSFDDPSTTDLLMSQDFNEIVDNGSDTFLNEKPSGRMLTINMIRQKHKMGLNALPKSKLKAARIRNRIKNFKNRLDSKKYYKQNKAVLKRYNKSYNAAIKAGKHQVAIRRKS